jgi:alpha-ketoglutarate-dependent taurine dioxygenase
MSSGGQENFADRVMQDAAEHAEIEACLMENVKIGHMTVTIDPTTGEKVFALTDAGRAHVEHLRKTDPETQELWARLEAGHAKKKGKQK